MAAVKVTKRSTNREGKDDKCNEFARAKIATYVNVHRKETRVSGEGRVILRSALLFDGPSVEDVIESDSGNGRSRKYWQGERKICLYVSYYRRVFRDDEVVECNVLTETSLAARKGLSYRALNKKLNDLKKQERSGTAELARYNVELKNAGGD